VSLPLYMDQHVRSEVTDGLRRRGVDVLTAFEDGAAAWIDERIFQRATGLGRVLFSQDQDFLTLAHERQRVGRDFAGLVYVHQLRLSLGEIIDGLELIAQVYDLEDMRDRVEYLPLS